jgi:hypothetical protein
MLSTIVHPATYFVSTSGSDANGGTANLPFATIVKAAGIALPGDTIWVRGGVYSTGGRISISRSGTATQSIMMFAYPGDPRPVLDFSGMPIGSSNQGVLLNNASYWYIKGMRICGAGDNGLQISGGGNNRIEFCDFFENRDAGLQLKNATHDNTIINCDSYYNADYVAGSSTYTGGNADGFAPKLDIGTGNSFYGCRAWLNSDDGWDGFLYSDLNITTTIENCWSWANGYLKDGKTTTSSMNGNGFKMGGGWTTDSVSVRHYTFRHNQVLKNCLSFNNKAKGFDQNHDVGSMTLFNCTGKGNGSNNFDIAEALAAGKILTVENCLSYENSKVKLLSSAVTATNSWAPALAAAPGDFVSIDTAGMSGPRKADGSLPEITFMHLAAGSKFIDAGTNIGLPFAGSAPDIGCFETGGTMGVAPSAAGSVQGFRLLQNYPNPFNPATVIPFELPGDARVTITVYSMIGSEVAIIASGFFSAGVHEIRFDGSHLGSGVYWYRLRAGSYADVKQMTLVK